MTAISAGSGRACRDARPRCWRAMVFLGLALLIIPFIPTAFIPAQDKAQSTLTIKLRAGRHLAGHRGDQPAVRRRCCAALPEVKGVLCRGRHGQRAVAA